ncbi:G2/mitotic-specific cyclin-4 [Paraphaeosphaeria minitans]|uniref:G2/mitotic-specific cyclin-4 n=1 Tax=Paraphaeosphaeria minitans TaxID=565426 RepID=A0A9P6KK49_9PLEO|nr:G2/mitotic-specific cyclin-4 [Paraphaeosphaeria minitans]
MKLSILPTWAGLSFLRRVSRADDYDLETRTFARHVFKIAILDERFVGCKPSFLAAGAHCLARFMLRKGGWSQAHVRYSGYTFNQLRSLLPALLECCEKPPKYLAAVHNKNMDEHHKRFSTTVETGIYKGFQLPFVFKHEFD